MSTAPAPDAKKRVLIIGLHPKAVDFTMTPDLNEEKLTAQLKAAVDDVVAAGFDVESCLTSNAWASAGPMITARLAEGPWSAIMIGAGIRALPAHFLLFEKVVNLVHEAAPTARICFNTSPDTTRDAVLRWVRR